MASRYDGVDTFTNNNKIYKSIFEDRGIKQVRQYGTRTLNYPTSDQLGQLTILPHRWVYGDHYYRLAHQYYGDPKMWWVIAFFNQRPTETDLRFGTVIYIPNPLERVLSFYGV
jgi:nucleoid-associated protein YgaU